MKKSPSNCPKCNGLGVLLENTDGNLYAKNCDCTKEKILINKAKFANIPEEFKDIKVAGFNPQIYTTEESKNRADAAKKIAKNYVYDFSKYMESGKGLYFYSNSKGSGKTMLAIAIGNAIMNYNGIMVKFVATVNLLAEIKASYGNEKGEKESDLINALKQVKVLILDDIGTERLTGWANEIFYQLINDRYINKLVTIFTSNIHSSQLEHDERIKDRINKMAMPVQMPEEGIRAQIAERENTEMIKELLGG